MEADVEVDEAGVTVSRQICWRISDASEGKLAD